MQKNKSTYVDGFVLVVPKNKTAEYKQMAALGGKIWKKYGALDYKECQLEDPCPKWVTFTFPKMSKAKPDETVWFSFITFKSKKHRDEVNAKVMKDPAMHPDSQQEKMPFDMKRMAYGGFTVEVSF